MNLLQLDNEEAVYVFVDYYFGKGVVILTMSITETDLLIVLLIETDRGVIEVLCEVIELDPEDAV